MSDESHAPAGAAGEMHPPRAVVEGKPGYEVRDTNVVAIGVFVAVLVVLLIVTEAGLLGFLKALNGPPAAPPGSSPLPQVSPYAEAPRAGNAVVPHRGKVTPEVVLEITEQRRELTAREDAALYGVGGEDSPIDRAMNTIVERGLPPIGGSPRTEVEVNSHSGTPAAKKGSTP